MSDEETRTGIPGNSFREFIPKSSFSQSHRNERRCEVTSIFWRSRRIFKPSEKLFHNAYSLYIFWPQLLILTTTHNFLFLLEHNCFTMLYVSAIQWSESALCVCVCVCDWLPTTSHPYGSPHSIKMSCLSYTVVPTSYLFYTWKHTCINPISQFIPPPHSFCLCLYSPLANRFIRTISLDSTYND